MQLRLDEEKWIQDWCSEAEQGFVKNDKRAKYKIKKQITNDFRHTQRNLLDKDSREEYDQLGDT